MKTHFLGNEKWHEVPADEVEEWDEFHRYLAAYLLGHGIQKATAVLELDGETWIVSVDLKRLPPEQIN